MNIEIEIYQYLAKHITLGVQSPEWQTATIETAMIFGSRSIQSIKYFTRKNDPQKNSFRLNNSPKNGINLLEVSEQLFQFLQKSPDDKPFNKYKFTLNNDDTFELEFKYDEDFAYLSSLDAESQEFDDLLELEVVDQIESWEGLPEDFPRPWLVSA